MGLRTRVALPSLMNVLPTLVKLVQSARNLLLLNQKVNVSYIRNLIDDFDTIESDRRRNIGNTFRTTQIIIKMIFVMSIYRSASIDLH